MTKNTSLFQKDLMQEAFKQSFVKLNPKIMFRNPVMFTVEIGTAVMFFVCIWILLRKQSQGSFAYNFLYFWFYCLPYYLPILRKPLPKQEESTSR
jgi:K+-transporting ATPase ATPase B chain